MYIRVFYLRPRGAVGDNYYSKKVTCKTEKKSPKYVNKAVKRSVLKH